MTKTIALVIGMCITVAGIVGTLAPSCLLWLAERFDTSFQWYALALVRLAIGVLLLSVSKSSRAPKTLRVVAFVPLLAGLAIPIVGVERARAAIAWWSLQGSGYMRLSALPVLVLGSLVMYACGPGRGTRAK